MLPNKQISDLIFWDLETTSQYPTFKDMPEKLQKIFKQRFKKDVTLIDADREQLTGDDVLVQAWYDEAIEELYSIKAPTQPEWLKIICISCAKLTVPETPDGDYVIKAIAYSGDDEKDLLERFLKGMTKAAEDVIKYAWVAHNGNMFDIPVLIKRIIINGIKMPKFLDVAQAKPWERTFHIDTKVNWACGVFDNHVSLDHLAAIFDVPSSKEDMHGGEVKDVYWVQKDLKRIAEYCNTDTYALAEIYMRIKGIKNKLIVQ